MMFGQRGPEGDQHQGSQRSAPAAQECLCAGTSWTHGHNLSMMGGPKGVSHCMVGRGCTSRSPASISETTASPASSASRSVESLDHTVDPAIALRTAAVSGHEIGLRSAVGGCTLHCTTCADRAYHERSRCKRRRRQRSEERRCPAATGKTLRAWLAICTAHTHP